MIAAGEVWTNPIIVGLIVGLPSAFFGWKAFWRTKEKDKEAIQAELRASRGDHMQLVIDGLNGLIANLRTDNLDLRTGKVEDHRLMAELAEQLTKCRDTCAALRREAAE